MRIVLEIEGAEVSITAKESGSKVKEGSALQTPSTASNSQGAAIATGAEDAGPAPSQEGQQRGAPTGPLDMAGMAPAAQAQGQQGAGVSGAEDAGPAPALNEVREGSPAGPRAAGRQSRSAPRDGAMDAGAAPKSAK